MTKAKLKKKLDSIFSQYIRYKYADHRDMVACYTCSVVKPVKEMQNGHWIPRNVLATRFDEDNCRPQCVGCNMFNRGRPDVFAVKLLNEGVDIKELQSRRYDITKRDIHWYKEQIDVYNSKIKKLKRDKI